MKKYANTHIKELIQKFPRVEDVLDEFKLPCKNCGDNNCLLKDIAETENFSETGPPPGSCPAMLYG